ncbi:reverse transcriptase [Holotrichia oblita]|uniref:Reverse transcriptase n=1 Tax=Holotrichia oblita TaxID=644536 RepID=A0ACB9T8R9_HOLOL|nr:reverse transcriptase [Holotrichia oblita]
MYRTPPRAVTTFTDAPLPSSPATEDSINENSQASRNIITQFDSDSTLTPQNMNLNLNKTPTDELTNEQIYEHIKSLQAILQQREANTLGYREQDLFLNLPDDTNGKNKNNSRSLSPLSVDTSFGSTSSLVETVNRKINLANRKRPASALSPTCITVDAQVHPSPGKKGRTCRILQSDNIKGGDISKRRKPIEDLDKIEVANSQNFSNVFSAPKGRRSSSPAPAEQSNSIEKTAKSNSPKTTDSTNDKIPPVILRDKSKWSAICNELKRKGIHFTKAQNIPDGIRIFPTREADYRSLTKFFMTESIPFHTFQLPSEKLLNVVLRGVPVEITEKEILEDLQNMGFNPEKVLRMRRTWDRVPMPLVLVKLSKDQKTIYHIKEVVSLEVSVETLKAKPAIGQCYRCQKFGHAQSRCTAPRRCVACAENHEPKECPRAKAEPATCANCNGTHPANYKGCSKYPRPRPFHPGTSAPPPPRSYSQAVAAGSRHPPRSPQSHTPGKTPRQAQSASEMPTAGRSYSRVAASNPQQQFRPSHTVTPAKAQRKDSVGAQYAKSQRTPHRDPVKNFNHNGISVAIVREPNKADQSIQNNSKIHIIANVVVNPPNDNQQFTCNDEDNLSNGGSRKSEQANDCSLSIQRITNSPVIETTQLIEQNHILTPTLVKSPFLGDYLTLPEPPKRKGKRNIERLPFAITSKKFQEMHEKKQKLELERERQKAERKRKREEIKRRRETTCKKRNRGNETKCYICGNLIHSKKIINCEDCKHFFHKSCIPRSHRIHIPNDDDNDNYLCHDCYREESDAESDIVMASSDIAYDSDKSQTENIIDMSIINLNSNNKSNAEKFNQRTDEESDTDKSNHENYEEVDSNAEIDLLYELYQSEIKKLL